MTYQLCKTKQDSFILGLILGVILGLFLMGTIEVILGVIG